MYDACVDALTKCETKLIQENKDGDVFDIHAKILDSHGYKNSRMNACGYSLGSTFVIYMLDVTT